MTKQISLYLDEEDYKFIDIKKKEFNIKTTNKLMKHLIRMNTVLKED